LGGGFAEAEALAELRDTHAFAELSDLEWLWLKEFITRGGPALKAYPGFQKVDVEEGQFRVRNRRVASLHRMSVGTITADGHLQVRFLKGKSLGQIEERFITRLKPREKFVFAGRLLTLSKIKDMTAYVKPASGGKAAVPRWGGGRMPLSTLLADAVLEMMEGADRGHADERLQPITDLLELQKQRSALPTPDRLLIEQIDSRDGHHLYLFPFAGRLAHEGLAALLAWRLARHVSQSYSMTVNDYGIELVGDERFELNDARCRELLSPDQLENDLLSALNAAEMARHRFRDIARIAGLVFQGYPGRGKQMRQIQASSGLMFDMLSEHDPDNLLLQLARREVLESEMELSRIRAALERIRGQTLALRQPGRLTPLAFPLWADRLRSRVSSEDFERRVERMLATLEPKS
ncbi:MAG: DNA ligase-associated DEXH box helicase, partial [Pseudomonadota bacterium]